MGLDSSGPSSLNFPKPAAGTVPAAADILIAARKSVLDILQKSREVAINIDKSRERWRGLEDRLPALEAALRPLHSQSLLVKNLEAKIETAIVPAEVVLKTFEMVHGLETVIKGDPRDDIFLYLASMSQLEEAVQHLSRNCLVAVKRIADAKQFLAESNTADKYRMYRLNERLASVQQDINSGGSWDLGLLNIALTKLDSTFKSILLESSNTIILPPAVLGPEDSSQESSPPPLPILLPAPVTAQLQTIVERLKEHKWVDNVLEIYREQRLAGIRESLESLKPDYLQYSTPDKVDQIEWNDLEGMIELWTQHIEVACILLCRSERRLCARVFDKLEKEKWIRCWGKVATGGFSPFLSFGEGVVQSQTAPEKLFKLLDMYDAMENLLPHVFEVFEGADAGCGEVRVRSRELLRKIAHKASETIWELGRFVEDGRGDVPPDGGRSRLCSYVVNYIKYLVSEFYGPTMAKIVRVEKSWQDRAVNDDTPDKWLSLVVTHVMQSLERHVVKQAKSYDDPPLANVFMLNNFWYMVTRAKDSAIGPLLGDTWMKDSRRKVQQYTMEYQREAWGKALACLSREGLSVSSSGKGTREVAKQRLKSFTVSFEANCQKHSNWVVPEQDLKEGIRMAVTQAVVPAYRSFIHWSLVDQGSNIGKLIKFSPEQVETMLGDLFEEKAQNSMPLNGFSTNSQHKNVEIQSY